MLNIINITEQDYLKKSQTYNVIPVCKKYISDTETPATIFLKLKKYADDENDGVFLLESVEGAKKLARFSFIGASFSHKIIFNDGLIKIYKKIENKNIDNQKIEKINKTDFANEPANKSENKSANKLSNIYTNKLAHKIANKPANKLSACSYSLCFSKKTEDPLYELEKFMSQYRIYRDPQLNHFVGGAVGFLSYDLVKYFEKIKLPRKKSPFPEISIYLTDTIIVIDHVLNTLGIIATVKNDEDASPLLAYEKSIKKIKYFENLIFKNNYSASHSFNNYIVSTSNSNSSPNFSIYSNFSKEEFIDAVNKTKRYINDGEVFQLVLSQKFEININNNINYNFNNNVNNNFDSTGNITTKTNKIDHIDNIGNTDSVNNTNLNDFYSFNIYRVLRNLNPSPYMYFLSFKDFKIIGSSPEPLIKITGRKIITCPIAGTRKRGKNQSEDKKIISSLLNDEKEKAEHNMLVDLSRNDLGRICQYGTIKIKRYMKVEKYSHVMHLVTRIEGRLKDNKTIFDALKATFPAGTLTGAPKVRAMQLISELEPERRGPYGGIVGYFGYDNSLDCCITIRTALIKDNKIFIQAGAGIVYDSIAENEYNETLNKASALINAAVEAVRTACSVNAACAAGSSGLVSAAGASGLLSAAGAAGLAELDSSADVFGLASESKASSTDGLETVSGKASLAGLSGPPDIFGAVGEVNGKNK